MAKDKEELPGMEYKYLIAYPGSEENLNKLLTERK